MAKIASVADLMALFIKDEATFQKWPDHPYKPGWRSIMLTNKQGAWLQDLCRKEQGQLRSEGHDFQKNVVVGSCNFVATFDWGIRNNKSNPLYYRLSAAPAAVDQRMQELETQVSHSEVSIYGPAYKIESWEKAASAKKTAEAHHIFQLENCITFRKTKEVYGGLSNMAAGFPLVINDVHIRTSEALYQALRFPHLPDVQKEIIEQKSPMAAKMKSKPHRHLTRSDWEKVKVDIMAWCLKVKLVQNWEKFSQLLLETGDKQIVELSHKDMFWGAVPSKNPEIKLANGQNKLGCLLTELREQLKSLKSDERLLAVPPLDIPNFALYLQNIPSVD